MRDFKIHHTKGTRVRSKGSKIKTLLAAKLVSVIPNTIKRLTMCMDNGGRRHSDFILKTKCTNFKNVLTLQ